MEKSKLQEGLEEIIDSSKVDGLNADIRVSIYNMETRESINVGGDIRGWAASIIKVPIMVSVLEEVEKRNFSLFEDLLVDHKFTLEEFDYVSQLSDGEEISPFYLLGYMIRDSDNEATNMLVNAIGGPNIVNRSMWNLGMGNSMLGHLLCPGVPRYTSDFNRDGSNITSPGDMVEVMRQIYDEDHSKLSYFVRKSSDLIMGLTSQRYFGSGNLGDSIIKSKGGFISDLENGADVHDVGIIDDKIIYSFMANRVKRDDSGSQPFRLRFSRFPEFSVQKVYSDILRYLDEME